jgi:hypothetical protein
MFTCLSDADIAGDSSAHVIVYRSFMIAPVFREEEAQ